MKIDFVNGLLQTSITTTYKGKTLLIDKLVIDSVQLGDFEIQNFKLDIGVLHEQLDIHGLIGLDLLIAANMIIDLSQLAIYPAKPN